MKVMKLHKLNRQLLLLGEHCYLDTSDDCYFTDVYQCRQRRGNKALIMRLKEKDKSTIADVAEQLSGALPPQWRRSATFIPMPPSVGKSSAVSAVIDIVSQLRVADTRDLLVQRCDTLPSHAGWRPAPLHRSELLTVREDSLGTDPTSVVVVDDVLTTGSHFRAAKIVLRRRWPCVRVIGLFIARACSRRYNSCFWEMAGCTGHCPCMPEGELWDNTPSYVMDVARNYDLRRVNE